MSEERLKILSPAWTLENMVYSDLDADKTTMAFLVHMEFQEAEPFGMVTIGDGSKVPYSLIVESLLADEGLLEKVFPETGHDCGKLTDAYLDLV